MLAQIYSWAYVGVIAFAVLWLFLKERQSSVRGWATGGFWMSVVTYVLTMLLDDGSLIFKFLWLLPRDMVFFILIGLFANKYLKAPKIFYLGLAVVFVGFKIFYWNFLQTSFQQDFNSLFNWTNEKSISKNYDADPNAEILFDIRSEQDLAEIKTLLADYEPVMVKAFPELQNADYSELEEYYTLNVRNNADLDVVMEKLTEAGLVDWAEPNEIMKLDLPKNNEPIEAHRGDYGLNDPNLDKLWGFEKMNVAKFYKLLKKNNIQPVKKAKIAILDTGIDSNHEDISGNYTSTEAEYDTDKLGHGTHCAGIAAAVSNNAKGIASFAPSADFVEVTSIKVLNDQGYGTQWSILKGVIKATDQGAAVISLSLGGPANRSQQKAYNEVVKYANRGGAILVVAAGNSNENAKDYSPANVEGVIAVSAVDQELKRAEFSNYITDLKMGIAAPGVNIFSTFPNNEYRPLNGTSMATPYVAGLIGIIKSLKPDMTTSEVYNLLKTKGIDTQDTEKTGKFIQADKILLQ